MKKIYKEDVDNYVEMKKTMLYSENKVKKQYFYTYTQGYQRIVYKYGVFILFTCIPIITKKVWISNKINKLYTI